MKRLLILLSGACVLWCCAAQIASEKSNGLLRYISCENASFYAKWKLKEGSHRYQVSVSGNALAPVFSTNAFLGSRSLLFQVPSGKSTQRFEYKICKHNEPDALNFKNERFVSFAVKIPDDFDALKGSLIFFQAWQGRPWGPPVMLKVTSGNNPYNVRLTIRNQQTGPGSNHVDFKHADKELWSHKMYKNKWYHFVVGIKPRVSGNTSHIQLWMDDKKELNWENKGNIGFAPNAFTTNKPYSGLTLKFGIYQPGSNNKHSLLFDEIRFASKYQDALPKQQ